MLILRRTFSQICPVLPQPSSGGFVLLACGFYPHALLIRAGLNPRAKFTNPRLRRGLPAVRYVLPQPSSGGFVLLACGFYPHALLIRAGLNPRAKFTNPRLRRGLPEARCVPGSARHLRSDAFEAGLVYTQLPEACQHLRYLEYHTHVANRKARLASNCGLLNARSYP